MRCTSRIGECASKRRGQMTIELAVAFPVLIAVAVIAVNAMTFFADCAAFDRLAHESVRIHATAPAYHQGQAQSCSLVTADLKAALPRENLEMSVVCEAVAFDCEKFTATLEYSPTLFGMGLRSEVFGVSMPKLKHQTSFVVDVYKPGVFA